MSDKFAQRFISIFPIVWIAWVVWWFWVFFATTTNTNDIKTQEAQPRCNTSIEIEKKEATK